VKSLSHAPSWLASKLSPRTLAKWKSAGILLTYRCNAECADCYENSGPRQTAKLSLDALRSILRELKKLGFSGRDLHFGGGEPFYDYEHLVACLQVAKEEGMLPLGKLETNGFWCKSEKLARERLTEIKDFGVDELMISCDAFHQEFVPIEAVRTAERIGKEILGEDAININQREFLENPIDMRPLSEAEKTEVFRELLAQQPWRIIGRAAKSLPHLVRAYPKESFASASCARKLLKKRSIHIDPHGSVFPSVCAGITLGNASEQPLSEIYEDFEYRDHPMLATLAERGPLPLLEEAVARGFAERKEGYSSKCHLCYDVRTFFHEQGMYPDEVGPAEVYGE